MPNIITHHLYKEGNPLKTVHATIPIPEVVSVEFYERNWVMLEEIGYVNAKYFAYDDTNTPTKVRISK